MDSKEINNLPRFIVKNCKGCGADMHQSQHHTLCNKCWQKVNGVKVQNTSSGHSKIDGHSAKYFKAMYNTIKTHNATLINEVNRQKNVIAELNEKITQLTSEKLLEGKEVVEKDYVDNLRKRIDNQRDALSQQAKVVIKQVEKIKKLEEEKNEV